MRALIQKLVKKFPEGGIAIHGTAFSNVASIKRNGIIKGMPYVCPFPYRREFFRYSNPVEILERSIGSAFFAGKYALQKTPLPRMGLTLDLMVPEVKEADLPAIVVLKGKTLGEFSSGYDEEVGQEKASFTKRQYRSFGKSPGAVLRNRIAAVVRITPSEYNKLIRKAHGDIFKAKSLIKTRLAMKTLLAIRKIVERGEK